MTTITLEQALAMLPEIVRRLPPGEQITITDHEQPLRRSSMNDHLHDEEAIFHIARRLPPRSAGGGCVVHQRADAVIGGHPAPRGQQSEHRPGRFRIRPFSQFGGLGKANELFDDKLPELLEELNARLTMKVTLQGTGARQNFGDKLTVAKTPSKLLLCELPWSRKDSVKD